MGVYVVLTSLTEEGKKSLKENPEGIRELNAEVEKMGARILQQYAVFGLYDFVSIMEAPNNEVIFKMAVETGSRGSFQAMTRPAMPIDEFIQTLKK